MPKAAPIQTSFARGIQGALLDGNILAPARDQSYSDSQNLIPIKQGPVVRRGGTKWVGEVFDTSEEVIIKGFNRNSSESYVAEFTDLRVLFYKDEAPVTLLPVAITSITASTNLITTATSHGLSTGSSDQFIVADSLEPTINGRRLKVRTAPSGTTLTVNDMNGDQVLFGTDRGAGGTTAEIYKINSNLADYSFLNPSGYDPVQSQAIDIQPVNDTLFITHPSEVMQSLNRGTTDTDWSFTNIEFKDGPYLPLDTDGGTITLSAGSGTVTCTLTATNGIFLSTDTSGTGGTGLSTAHRQIRLRDGSSGDNDAWVWATIEGFTSSKVVSITIQEGGSLTDFTDITDFRLGLFHSGATSIPGEPAKVISDANKANPCVVEIIGHGLSFGEIIKIDNVQGMTELNGSAYIVTIIDVDNVSLQDLSSTTIDSTGFSTYTVDTFADATLAWMNLPRHSTIVEDRIALDGPIENPDRVAFSVTGGYSPRVIRFDPTEVADGTVTADLGFTPILGGSDVSFIKWMRPTKFGLAIGTSTGEGIIQASTQGEGLTPANATYKENSTSGSSFAPPIALSGAILFIQRAGRRLHEYGYIFDQDRHKSTDMSALAYELTLGGVKQLAWQQEPNNVLWVLRTDGVLLGFTYDREEGILGWHKHVIGGTDAVVKSIAVIPSADGFSDTLWMVVSRIINSNTVQSVEYMTNPYTSDVDAEDAYHLDAGRTYNGDEFAMSAATQAEPVVITTATHSRAIGEYIHIKDVVGMTELNGNTYQITAVTATTMTLAHLNGADLDGTGFTAYTSGGTATHSLTTIQNLHHLEGETVSLLVDAKTHPDLTVQSGAITLTSPVSGHTISVGLANPWFLKTLRLEAGSADGTAQGKTKRIHRLVVRLKDSLGFKYGPNEDKQDDHPFDNLLTLDTATGLHTGDIVLDWNGGYESVGSDSTSEMFFSGNTPFPVQIQALMAQVNTQDSR